MPKGRSCPFLIIHGRCRYRSYPGSPEACARLKLGYLDPTKIELTEWQNREYEGILYVPKVGEIPDYLTER